MAMFESSNTRGCRSKSSGVAGCEYVDDDDLVVEYWCDDSMRVVLPLALDAEAALEDLVRLEPLLTRDVLRELDTLLAEPWRALLLRDMSLR